MKYNKGRTISGDIMIMVEKMCNHSAKGLEISLFGKEVTSILDMGSAFHMTPCREWFVDYR